MRKPFFFRIEAAELLNFATDEESDGVTLLKFAKDLQRGCSDVPFIQKVIDEAHNYIEKKKIAGKSGGLAKASSAIAKASSAIAEPSTPLASSSNSNKKNKPLPPPKTQYAEFVHMAKDEFEKLISEHGEEKTLWMVNKLNSYKGSKGVTYKSDYLAILNWVVKEAVCGFKSTEQKRDPNLWY